MFFFFFFARNMLMHCTFFFLLSCALKFLLWLCFFLFYLSLSFSLLFMAPKKFVPSENPILHGSFSSLFPLILFVSMMKRHIMTSLRTFLTRWFIRNARSFCLISQTLLYPVLLALKDGLLLWEALKVSRRVYTGVLLQYARPRYLCTLVYYGILWYMYHSHLGLHFRGATDA